MALAGHLAAQAEVGKNENKTAPQGGTTVFGNPVETDPDSGASVFLLGGDERPADNIYGEQPYGDATGRRIAIRCYSTDSKPGGISLADLVDGSRHEGLVGKPPFPAFHAWGEYLYYHQTVDGKLTLRRCNYLTADNKWLIFTSTRDGHPQVYGARLVDGWLEGL